MLRDALREGPVWALGTMSGTSLDGVDAAMILTDGDRVFDFGATRFRPYDDADRAVLRDALGRWKGLEAAAEVVERTHAEVLSTMTGAKLVGFHGQTTAHDPASRRTSQIGDGRFLSHVLDLPVVWDFRSADVALGGQGAPLAAFYHHALARHLRLEGPVGFLNLGGVGNLTLVDPRIANPAEPGACLGFDTGPANAPVDDLIFKRLGLPRDENGALAGTGSPDEGVLSRLADADYFRRLPPKSLDRDDFSWLLDAVADLSDADAAATLTSAAALSVSLGLEHCPVPPERILVSGGGRHNAVMMTMIAAGCDCPVTPVEDVGLDGDMIEAQAFAYLAVRVVRGWSTSAPSTTGVPAAVGGGVVSEPGDMTEGLAG